MKLSGSTIQYILSLFLVLGLPAYGCCESKIFEAATELIAKELSVLTTQATPNNVDGSCYQDYSELYSDDMMRVSFFLGVMNTTKNLCLDRPAKQALTEYLTKECSPHLFACGFIQTSEDPVVLQKKAPDSKNIIVSIYDSSVSEIIQKNTVDLAAEQQIKSDIISNQFFKSLENDDIIFYLGHSRYGTGPGFYNLPFLSKKWLSTYIQAPVLSTMIETLNQTSSRPKLFGLFSCSSERYYAKELHRVAPDMALIVSTGMTYYYSNIVEAVGSLNSILGNVCLSKSNGTLRNNENLNSKYILYGLSERRVFPAFRKNISIFSITVLLLLLPFIVVATSKINVIQICSPFETNFLSKDLVTVSIVSAVIFAVIKYLSRFSDDIVRQSIPMFFGLVGALLFISFLYQKRINYHDIWLTCKGSVAPLLISMLVYWGINLYPTADDFQLYFSIIQSIKLLLFYLAVLPYYIFTTGIVQYPLLAWKKIRIPFRILFSINVSGIFCIVTAYLLAKLNVPLLNYTDTIFVVLFVLQLVSLLYYSYMRNTRFPVVYQALTLAVLFSENIHGLPY